MLCFGCGLCLSTQSLLSASFVYQILCDLPCVLLCVVFYILEVPDICGHGTASEVWARQYMQPPMSNVPISFRALPVGKLLHCSLCDRPGRKGQSEEGLSASAGAIINMASPRSYESKVRVPCRPEDRTILVWGWLRPSVNAE